MLAFTCNDSASALARANRVDAIVIGAATAFGGQHQAGLTALTLRQAFAETELTGTVDNPYLFLEAIRSGNTVSTVDLLYPSMPACLHMNRELGRHLIAPMISCPGSGQWPAAWAPHDLRATYPNATEHNDGGGENMPVEETANLLIMADAWVQRASPANAAAYAQVHHAPFHQWA